MATARRLSYSLLISTLAFAVFAVVAFSGLFPWVETQFYSPKVVTELQIRLDRASAAADSWKVQTVSRLDKLLGDGAFEGVFSPTLDRDRIQKRFQSTKLFLLGLRGGGTLRILNADRTQVHFSSEDSDVKAKTDLSLTYKPVTEIADLPDFKLAGLDDGTVHVLSDPLGQSLYFLRPWKDSQGLLPGFALLSVSLEDFRLGLLEAGVPLGTQPIVPLGGEEYVLSLLGQKVDAAVLTRVKDLRAQGILPPVQKLARADGQTVVALVHKGSLSFLVPASTLELDPTLKILVLVSFYTVLFLVAFLLANLRGEPLSVVTRKVKRFQLQVVRQYLDLKEQDKIQSLREELARHSDEIRLDVRKSLGRVRKRDQEWVDRYIDTSWQEVMDLLRGPAPPVESASQADWKRLETLLQQALTQGRFVVSTGTAPAPVTPPRPHRAEPVEEVEELEEVEEAEEVDDLEEVADGVEDAELVEDAEPVEDLEEIEDAEPAEELEDASEVEPLEDLEEAETVVEPEELQEAEEVEELESLEEADTDSDDAGELEDLSETPLPVYSLRGGQTAELPTLDAEPVELESEEDVEMLEDLEDAVEELEEEVEDVDLSFSLERLDDVWGASSADVFAQQDEVVTLKDEIFAEAGTPHDDFGHLVDEVLAGGESSEFEPLEEDLVPHVQVRDWRWTGGGFDWDRFALGTDEVNLFRALSDIVTEFDAFTAAILTQREGRWTAQSSVGFSDSGKALLDYTADAPLVRGFLSIRALHMLQGGSSHSVLRASFHTKDLKFLKTILCVPLLYHHEPSWLLLGLRRQPADLLALLAPRKVG
jgi:hypothetical protein